MTPVVEKDLKKIKMIGITGTNGKTTITYLLESIIHCTGKRSGVIGTVNHRFADKQFRAKNTTPGLLENQRYLAEMLDANMDYCIMEVSSHGLAQGRVKGIDFHVAVFTNLTSDHLDYHKDREEYFQVKAVLFNCLSKNASAVINTDDTYGNRLLGMTRSAVTTYGIKHKADIMAEDIDLSLSGTTFTLITPVGEISIETKLIGMHNVYNILAAVGVCLHENVSLSKIKEGIEGLAFVPGRLEEIKCGQDFYVFVDYAHTEDALRSVLESLKYINGARRILVFGCGGDRDRDKRPKMGRIASDLADFTVLTNDNPRSEDPKDVVDQIAAGFNNNNYEVILDRREAINKGLMSAKTGDIVLIAGKGHEEYQIFKDNTIDFNEREIVRDCLHYTKSERS